MQDSNTALAPVVVPPTPLSAQHHHLLAVESGMAPALMTARGSRTITRTADLGALGRDQTRPDAAGPAGRRAAL